LALGYYNYRVTGSPLRLPYVEYSAQYEIAPPLLFAAMTVPSESSSMRLTAAGAGWTSGAQVPV